MKKALVFLLFIISFITACNEDMAYSKYADISTVGWERSDSIVFNIPPLKKSGIYNLVLGTRISNDFPFKSIDVIVEQTVYPKKITYCDTITYHFFDNDGRMLGSGISNHQYLCSVSSHSYQQNDSVHIYVRHNMKREILTGITSVGIELSNNSSKSNY